MKNKDNSFFASFTANTPLYKLDEFVNGFRKKTVNKAVKSNVSTQLKAIDKLIKDKKVEESMAKLKVVMSVLHKSTKKKIMHLNKASRTISKLQKDITAISK